MRTFTRCFSVVVLLVATFLWPAQLRADTGIQSISWRPLDCGAGDPVGDQNPAATDLVGDTANGKYSAYYAFDDNYLYLRQRVNGDPSGTQGFAQYAWTMLLQVPSGSPFQYQYMVSLNGNNTPGFNADTVELWRNNPAAPIDWTPIFRDDAEINLWRVVYTGAGPFGGRLASSEVANSNLGGNPDYFVNWAVPISVLRAGGVISQPSDLEQVLFFPATSTQSNSYNKDYLNCPFLPKTELTLDKTVTPSVIYTAETPQPWLATYTFVVTNIGTTPAVGVVLEDNFTPFIITPPGVMCLSITSISHQITGENSGPVTIVTPVAFPGKPPLKITADKLAAGGQLTVVLVANVNDCGNAGQFLNTASTYATNAAEVQDTALFRLDPNPSSVTLARFEAFAQEGGILVEWETATELDNVGFNLYRAEAATGPWVQLNETLIPAANPGAVFGSVYTWHDAAVEPGVTYFYWLEDMDIAGVSTFHGPVQATALPVKPSAISVTAFSAGGHVAAWLPAVLGALTLLGGWERRRRR